MRRQIEIQLVKMAILQWNCNGFYSHLPELQHIISNINPLYIFIQESRLQPHQKCKLSGYKPYRKDRQNSSIASGGVTILAQNQIPANEIKLNTELEAIAISTYVPQMSKITICNVYLPPNKLFTQKQLEELVQQLPPPFLLVGDLNSHNTLWGSNYTDGRGRKIEKFINNKRILLNDYSHTHFCARTGHFSVIDLSICDASLAPNLKWEVIPQLWGSDHYPIKISFPDILETKQYINKWKLKEADWTLFQKLARINILDGQKTNDIDDEIKHFTKHIINAGEESVGYTKAGNRIKKTTPWWNTECHEATKQLKTALNRYKKSKNLEDLINLKKCRAISRRTILSSKKKSWEDFTSTIDLNTPPTKIWEKIRKIKGNRSTKLTTTIIKDNQAVTSPQGIADTLAKSFQYNSSNQNYKDSFIKYKETVESTKLSIENDNSDINSPFDKFELTYAIKQLKDNKSPGPDGIPSEFLKKLPEETLEYLLQIYNQIWQHKKYPKQWQEAITIPILKPNKDKSNPDSYRPISITNTLSKILQIMVNKRMVWYLETKNLLCNIQSGFRRGRSTMDHIVMLTTEIQKTFKNREHLIAVFFDLQKAYDMTWRHHILKSLIELGLNGNIVEYAKNFMTDRRFKVRANGYSSEEMVQENGVPQGEIFSTTLFLVAINKIADQIKLPVKACLFADDLVIFCSGKHLNTIKSHLQKAISNLEIWCNTTGFQFSASKTKAIHFNKRQYNQYNPRLELENNSIEYVDEMIFLGITLDKKLNWKKHLTNLKKECSHRLNILKTLGSQKWGANREILLRLYQALIRSKLEYGCIAYSNAKPTSLKIIEPVQNAAIRISTGALRTSPIKSISYESNQLSLSYRRSYLTLSYLTNLASNSNIPTHQQIFNNTDNRITIQNQTPYHENILNTLNNLNISFPNISKHSYNQVPPWKIKHPNINLSLAKHKKLDTHPKEYIKLYNEIKSRFKKSYDIFTDGSKITDKIGAAVIFEEQQHQFHLPDVTSISTAEAFSVLKATDQILKTEQNQGHYVVHIDSLNVVKSINQLYIKNPLIQNIQDNIHHAISNGKNITLIWIPSHAGIPGNEKADIAAKESVNNTLTAISTSTNDMKTYIKQRIRTEWDTQWSTTANNHFQAIKDNTNYWAPRNNRREQVIITRLRIGHTVLTHKHIFEHSDPITCDTCNTRLTVQHLLLECQKYLVQRAINKIPTTLKEALSNNSDTLSNVLQYLKDIDLSHKI